MCHKSSHQHHWCDDCDTDAWMIVILCLAIMIPCALYLAHVWLAKP